MPDITVIQSYSKNRCFLVPQSQKGVDWVWDNYTADDIGPSDIVGISIDVLEDIKIILEAGQIEFEVR